MILIGTSGYDYADWKDLFYPKSLSRKRWLEYYAERFPALELNFSYYRMPERKQIASMVERSDGKLEFAIKAHRSMTHERTATDADIDAFNDAVQPFREAGRLGAVLAQFPNSFRQCEENRSYLGRLADRLGPPLVVELRRAEWSEKPILNWLKRLGVGYCCVDEPKLRGLMPTTAAATANPAYVRFHGRNAAKWYNHDRPEERYDYTYRSEELKEWVPKIEKLESETGKVLVFFNNHFKGQAVDAAGALKGLLDQG